MPDLNPPIPTPTSLCVFCGSSAGNSPAIHAAAQEMGALLARRDITLIYGGGGRGLMRVLADAAMAAGGRVIGVIPRDMVEREWAHGGLTELRLVDTMHQRKAMMAHLADAFVALPGGIGTIDEFFEIWTWRQIGLHAKPYGLLNVEGYFDHLLAFVDHMVGVQFLPAEWRDMLIVEPNAAALLQRIMSHV